MKDLFVLFTILAIGMWLGHFTWRGTSLGTAGVLFIAIVFGNYGLVVNPLITLLGLLLFVFAVGIQAGPHFFSTFRRQWARFLTIGVAICGTGALLTFVVAHYMRIPYDFAAGLYAGSLTFAAAMDSVEHVVGPAHLKNVAVGYGIGYPFSMLGVVVLIQFMPKLFRRDLGAEEARWEAEKGDEPVALETREIVVQSPYYAGKHFDDIDLHRLCQVNISRIRRHGREFPATAERVLLIGDSLTMVGPAMELDKAEELLGAQEDAEPVADSNVVKADVVVTEPTVAGRRIQDIESLREFGVVATRIRHHGEEVVPVGRGRVEMGDTLRIVGDRESVKAFVKAVQNRRQKEEISYVTFLVGLALGAALGMVPLPLPGGFQLQLGIAGGGFLMGLMIGRIGRIGRHPLYVPTAARNLSRELGLMLFLAGAGTAAGSNILRVLHEQGPSMFLAGAIITVGSVAVGLIVMHGCYRMNLLATMGGLCACMTNPPGLSATNAQTETDLPTLSWASLYPVAVILKVMLTQIIAQVLMR